MTREKCAQVEQFIRLVTELQEQVSRPRRVKECESEADTVFPSADSTIRARSEVNEIGSLRSEAGSCPLGLPCTPRCRALRDCQTVTEVERS